MMYISKYKSLDIKGLLAEIHRLKFSKYQDLLKLEKLQFLSKEILIKA